MKPGDYVLIRYRGEPVAAGIVDTITKDRVRLACVPGVFSCSGRVKWDVDPGTGITVELFDPAAAFRLLATREELLAEIDRLTARVTGGR